MTTPVQKNSKTKNDKGLHGPGTDVPFNTPNPVTVDTGGIWGEQTLRSGWDSSYCSPTE